MLICDLSTLELFGVLAFSVFTHPGKSRAFRLLGANLGCPACFHCATPSGAGVLPPYRRQDPGLGGGLRIMQDTPNSYLEVERRDFFLGILGSGLGRRECFRGRGIVPF